MKNQKNNLSFKIFILQRLMDIVILSPAFFIAWLYDKIIPLIFLLISFFSLRYTFEKTYHCDNTIKCILATIIMLSIMTLAVLPLRLSLVSSVIISLIDCLVLYKIKDYGDIRTELDEFKKPKGFDINYCTKQELVDKCNSLKFSKNNIELAIMFFIEKKSHNEIADILKVEVKSVTTRKKRMKIKLNN